jgi:hypothetical protein
MEMADVPASTNVARIGYDAATLTLAIEFRNGSQYQYFDVPQHIFDGLRQADSVGKYINTQIKGVFRFARL